MTNNTTVHVFINVIMFLTGLIVGNRLAIGRGKRKEFNIVAETIRLALIREREFIINKNMAFNGPEDADFKKFTFLLSRYKLRRFNRTLVKYKENKKTNQHSNRYGESSYHDNTSILKIIDRLIKLTKLK